MGEYSSSEPQPMTAPSSDASVCKSVCDTAATAAAGAATTAARGERVGARPRDEVRHGLRSAATPTRQHGDACGPRRRTGACDAAAEQRGCACGAGAPQRGSSRAVSTAAIAPGAAGCTAPLPRVCMRRQSRREASAARRVRFLESNDDVSTRAKPLALRSPGRPAGYRRRLRLLCARRVGGGSFCWQPWPFRCVLYRRRAAQRAGYTQLRACGPRFPAR